MKTRRNFVSNSSSTSFVCELCGKRESVWDSEPMEDYGFLQCKNGHTICDSEAFDVDPGMDDFMSDDSDERRCLNDKYCPICQFEASSKSVMKQYLKKMYGVTDEEVFAEVKKNNGRRKKLYDIDYVNYVYAKHNLQEQTLLAELKQKYGSYTVFQESI